MIEAAQAKLALLAQGASDAQALAMSAKQQVGDAERRAHLLINSKASDLDIAKAMAAVEAAQDRMLVRKRIWDGREQTLAQCRSWLNELPRNVTLETVSTAVTNRNGAPAVAIADIRSQIAKLAAEYHQVTAAGPTRDDALLQINSLVQSLAARGRPRVDIQRGELRVSGWMGDGMNAPTPHSVTVNFMAWLAPDLMTAALERELQAVPVDAHALPLDQRKVRLAEIEEEIALLEAREEAVIERAHQDGVVIERRFDQSPASILGVRIAAAAARVAA